MVVPIFQRQRNVLNLTYWHAIILTHRQAVMNNFVHISRQGGENNTNDDPHTDESVQQCLEASMHTMDTIDEIMQSRQMFHAFWVRLP